METTEINILPGSSIISAKDADDFFVDINLKIKREFKGNRNLKVLNLVKNDDNYLVCGSNPLILPLAQDLIPSKRIGRPEDYQKGRIQIGNFWLEDSYSVDMGLVLDFSRMNHAMALDYWGQMPIEQRNLDGLPSVIVGYGLKNFNGANCGLGLVYNEKTQVRPTLILENKYFRFRDCDVSQDHGLPFRMNEEGDRTLFTTPQKLRSIENIGFSRLSIFGYRNIYAGSGNLTISNSSNRIVVFNK